MSKLSIEQLDELQFGRRLHQRPTDEELVQLVVPTIEQAILSVLDGQNISIFHGQANGELLIDYPAFACSLAASIVRAAIAALREAGAMK